MDDNTTFAHILYLHNDMSEILKFVGRMPKQLRAEALAARAGQPVDSEAIDRIRADIENLPITDLILPAHRPLYDRLTAMQPRTKRLLYEVLLCRAVDTFLTYVSEIIALTFTRKPETLKSERTVTLHEVLSHSSLEDFVTWYSDRRVAALSYKGLDEVEQFIQSQFGLSLAETDSTRNRVRELIAVRNCLVHNSGLIDSKLVDAASEQFGFRGEPLDAAKLWASRHVDELSAVVRTFDQKVAAKFGLTTTPFVAPNPWSDPSAPPH